MGAATAEGDRSVALAGDAIASVIVTGSGNTLNLELGGADGDLLDLLLKRGPAGPTKHPRSLPVRVRPAPAADHVGREAETATLLGRAAPGAPVNVYGEEGVGKTYLLIHAANQSGVADRDGVVYLKGRQLRRQDLLQQLFEELFDCQPPNVQTEAQNRRDLRNKQLLVLVDSFELDREEAQSLFGDVPGCRFVVASPQRTVWQGTPLKLGGLSPADSLTIVEQELGPLSAAQRTAAEAVCAALGHNALAIRQAASVVRDEGIPLGEVAEWLGGAPDGRSEVVDRALGGMGPDEREVVVTLAALGTAPVGTEHLDALVDLTDLDATLARLQQARLVVAHSPRYSLSGISPSEVEALWRSDVEARVEQALDHYVAWVAGRRKDLRGLLAQSEALLALLRAAALRGRSADVAALGRALSAALSWSRRWGQWREVLEAVLDAARRAQDRRTEGWALHQLGTRAVALGEVAEGVALLREALSIREASGSRSEIATTHHNLAIASRLGRPPGRGGIPHLPILVLALLLALLGSGAGGYLLLRSDTVSLAVEAKGPGTVTSSPAAIDCGSSCTARVRQGTRLTLTATAARGALFAGWEGADCAGTGPCTLTMQRDSRIVATFPVEAAPTATHLLTVDKGGAAGTVTSVPPGIDCGRSCSASFADGTLVTLTAAAAKGAVFVGWQGACSGNLRCTLTVRGETSVLATFAQADSRLLMVERVGAPGTVTTQAGIDCGPSCQASFPPGTAVTLTAIPSGGAAFAGWQGGGCSGTGPCTVTLARDTRVVARFTPAGVADAPTSTPRLTVEKVGAGRGSVTSAPAGISCGTLCQANLPSGTSVTLTASAAPGSIFGGWDGLGCSGTGACTLSLTQDRKVTATFLPARTLTVVSGQRGQVKSNPDGITCGTTCTLTLPVGAEVVLTAIPDAGAYFTGWSGPCQPDPGDNARCVVLLTEDRTIMAGFQKFAALTGAGAGREQPTVLDARRPPV